MQKKTESEAETTTAGACLGSEAAWQDCAGGLRVRQEPGPRAAGGRPWRLGQLRWLGRFPNLALPGVMLAVCAGGAWAGELPGRPAEGIQDNSFLVEEAYNQEAGVVQHILTAQFEWDREPGADNRGWLLAFTQEWPVFSQRHQPSYTVPGVFLDQAGHTERGLGDVSLNYRYQALFESESLPALAPRFSLILPTGGAETGLDLDTPGYQFNLPASKVFFDRWTLHANAGLTYLPDAREETALSYRLAGSAIYAVSRDFNVLLELVGDWIDRPGRGEPGGLEFLAVASPGLRCALNGPSSQWVLGLAAPIGLNRHTPELGLFFYLSFEHALKHNPQE